MESYRRCYRFLLKMFQLSPLTVIKYHHHLPKAPDARPVSTTNSPAEIGQQESWVSTGTKQEYSRLQSRIKMTSSQAMLSRVPVTVYHTVNVVSMQQPMRIDVEYSAHGSRLIMKNVSSWHYASKRLQPVSREPQAA